MHSAAEPTTPQPSDAHTREEIESIRVGPFTLSARVTLGDDTLLFDDGSLTGEPFDDTGLHRVWPASVALCHSLVARPEAVAGRRVLELGAGTGLPSLLCARHLCAAHVIATDSNRAAVERLQADDPHGPTALGLRPVLIDDVIYCKSSIT